MSNLLVKLRLSCYEALFFPFFFYTSNTQNLLLPDMQKQQNLTDNVKQDIRGQQATGCHKLEKSIDFYKEKRF